MLRRPAALPELIDLFRLYKNETGELAGDAIAAYGPEGFEILLELVADPSITGYHHTYLVDDAKPAGDDPVKRARLAELLRLLFTRVVGEVKETLAHEREQRVAQNQEKVENAASVEATQPGGGDELDAIREMESSNVMHPPRHLPFSHVIYAISRTPWRVT